MSEDKKAPETPPAPQPENPQAENTSTQFLTSSEYTQSEPPKRSWTKLFLIGVGGAMVGLVGLVAVTLVMEGPEAILGDGASNKEPIKAPPSAAEIIALEFAGKIEVAPVDPEALTPPTGAELPTTAELESRDFDEEAKEFLESGKDSKDKDKKKSDKAADKKSERKPASVDKSPLKLKFDKGASKVSKNLDKSKVLSYLAKKLDNSCQPKLAADTKSVRAEIKVSKTGSISNIKVSPSSAESELAKCMRQKLADAKVLKPKGKDTAKITVQFKLK